MKGNGPIAYDAEKGIWRIDGTGEEGCLTYVASEFCRGGVVYRYEHRGREIDGFSNHEHTLDGVLAAVLESPGDFYIPNECRGDYSEQELRFIEDFRAALLAVGGCKRRA